MSLHSICLCFIENHGRPILEKPDCCYTNVWCGVSACGMARCLQHLCRQRCKVLYRNALEQHCQSAGNVSFPAFSWISENLLGLKRSGPSIQNERHQETACFIHQIYGGKFFFNVHCLLQSLVCQTDEVLKPCVYALLSESLLHLEAKQIAAEVSSRGCCWNQYEIIPFSSAAVVCRVNCLSWSFDAIPLFLLICGVREAEAASVPLEPMHWKAREKQSNGRQGESILTNHLHA